MFYLIMYAILMLFTFGALMAITHGRRVSGEIYIIILCSILWPFLYLAFLVLCIIELRKVIRDNTLIEAGEKGENCG